MVRFKLGAGTALACKQQAAQSSERCSVCAERPTVGKLARHGSAAALVMVEQHPFTLRFRDVELERMFSGWHNSSQRMVRDDLCKLAYASPLRLLQPLSSCPH